MAKIETNRVTYLDANKITDLKLQLNDRKARLAAAFRIFGLFGYNPGIAGHISVRDPRDPERFWVNRFGMNFRTIRASDLVLVDSEGTLVEGEGPVNTAAFVIHSAVHSARPDVTAVAHAHSFYGKCWSAIAEPLLPYSQEDCAFYGDHAIFDEFNGVVVDPAESRRMAKALGSAKALIMKHHGLLTVGGSVDEAAWWFVALEESCRVNLAMRQVPGAQVIDPETARLTAAQIGNPAEGWTQFQPLYQWISRTEPDLFD